MTLLICPVRPGDSNPELMYALRSWEANLVLPGGLELVTVGYKPSWLSPDHHVEGNRFTSVPLAVWDNVLLAAQETRSEREVLFMNDDFFCLDPVGAVLPVKRDVTLTEQVAAFRGNTGLWWPRSLALTASWLSDQGYPSPDSYEVHRPLLANVELMVEALERFDMGGSSPVDMVPQWRTVYGTLNQIKAHPVKDCKLGLQGTGYGTPWVSTSDHSWRKYARDITRRFQKPSRWEV